MTKRMLTVAALVAIGLSTQSYAGGNAAAGKEKSQACAGCHGADGNSASTDFPRLAGQHADYIESALLQYKTGKRKNPIMGGMAKNLSRQDMADLAAYFSSQKGLVVKY